MIEEVESIDVHIRATPFLKNTIEELRTVMLGDEKVLLYTVSDITREALYKGLSLMMEERRFAQNLRSKKAKEGAKRLNASLKNKVAGIGQTEATDKKEESVKVSTEA